MEFIRNYFLAHPNQDLSHAQSKQEIEDAYFAEMGTRLEDSDRAIRRLHQQGFLIKVAKGVYRYDPNAVHKRDDLFEFDSETKKRILERDEYKCVICGLGKENGVELQIDHILARQYGGKASYENGQTLCAAHNFKKKISGQTETGKKMFIRLLELSEANQDENSEVVSSFCRDILAVFDKHGINGHIEWKSTS
jgi:hypothetical protein